MRALRRTGEEEYADCHHAGLDASGEYYEHDTNWLIQGAIHEYSHAFQTLFGAHTPAWLMEGGAVQLEAVFSNHASRGTYRKTYEDHFKHTIFPAAIDLYGDPSVATWLTTYGSDRECENDIPPGGVNANPDVFYNVGAAAVAFAIYKANINHAADGGRTFADFWTNTEKHKGFWHSIVVDDYEFNIDTDWPSQVPEGTGWKGALANFTGHDSVAAFYADFEAWIKPGAFSKRQRKCLTFLKIRPTSTRSRSSRSTTRTLLCLEAARRAAAHPPPSSACPPRRLIVVFRSSSSSSRRVSSRRSPYNSTPPMLCIIYYVLQDHV